MIYVFWYCTLQNATGGDRPVMNYSQMIQLLRCREPKDATSAGWRDC